MNQKDKKREIDQELTGWIDEVTLPLTDILGYVEEIENLREGLTKETYLKHRNFQKILSRLMEIGKCLIKLRENAPDEFEQYFYKVGIEQLQLSDFLFYLAIGNAIRSGNPLLVWFKLWTDCEDQ